MEKEVETAAAAVGTLDEKAMDEVRTRLDTLTKPPGSLGRLEELVVQLAGITGDVRPRVSPATVVVMAGDHGAAADGVSAFPSEVTPQMVLNFLRGGAAINVFGRLAGAKVRVIDMGVASDLNAPGLEVRKVRRGTDSFARGPAMSREEAAASVAAGIRVAEEEVKAGTRCIVMGDMGIGNTAASSCLLAVFGGLSPEEVTGRGTGLDDEGLRRKAEIIGRALEVNRPDPSDPLDVLAKVGGLEIAGLAGVALGAAAARCPVVVDGFIAGAAALVAGRIEPRVRPFLIAAHLSAEGAHRKLLELIGLDPLLNLGFRLGEGTGGALALNLLEASCRMLSEMATFAEAGVAGSLDGSVPGAADAEAPVIAGGSGVAAALADVEPRLPGRGATAPPNDFTPQEVRGVYKAIYRRRDIRSFRPDPLPPGVVERLLQAAHHAPSVGFMQPWNFILVRSPRTKDRLREMVDRERRAAAAHFPGERGDLFARLKVEGLLEAPLTICVTCDPTRGGPHVLGRSADRATDVYSVSCAVQNLWLAARAEGLAAGWVSIYQKGDLQEILGIPPHVDPIGLISVGYTDHFPEGPLLEQVGWRRRMPLADLVYAENWGCKAELAPADDPV